MTAIIDIFNAIRAQLQSMLTYVLGSLNSSTIQLAADIVLWFVWLWLMYHIFAKPFIKVLSLLVCWCRNPLFDELEEGE